VDPSLIDLQGLETLLARLREAGYRVLGPVVRDGAIVYAEIGGIADLPRGWRDAQAPGRYRLEPTEAPTLFGFNLGPQGWKRTFHTPTKPFSPGERGWGEGPTGSGPTDEASDPTKPLSLREGGWGEGPAAPAPIPTALIAARPCELAAIRIQDRVLKEGVYLDPHYAARREDTFVVAVNCTTAADTCFCAGMGTGPRARGGFDLALTELVDEQGHRFLVEAGSRHGEELLAAIPHEPAAAAAVEQAQALSRQVADAMTRRLPGGDLRARILERLESLHWNAVAERCLACGNCTQVCPTCFCTTVCDREDIVTGATWRERVWGSCFDDDFSYLHGGRVRPDIASRYRQWFIHKLATWHDQFGTSGCVGCGRCITWCPVGIDITAEAAALLGERP